MNRQTGVISLILIAIGLCSVNHADAGFFDKAENAAGQVLNKAKKANATKDTIIKYGDLIGEIAGDNAVGKSIKSATGKAKEVDSKAKEIANKGLEKASNVQGKVTEVTKKAAVVQEIGDAVGLGGVTKTLHEVTDKVDEKNKELTEKLGTEAEEFGIKKSDEDDAEVNSDSASADLPEDAETTSESPAVPEVTIPEVDETPVYSDDVVKKIDALIPSLEKLSQDKFLKIKGQKLSGEEVKYLAEKLAKLASEQISKLYLSLNDCGIDEIGVNDLLTAFDSHNQLLGTLSFAKNEIGDEGARFLAAHLKELPLLSGIILSNTGLSGAGAVELLAQIAALAKAHNGTNIQLIDLSNNNISGEYLDLIKAQCELIQEYQEVLILLHDNPIKNPNIFRLPSYIKVRLNS